MQSDTKQWNKASGVLISAKSTKKFSTQKRKVVERKGIKFD